MHEPLRLATGRWATRFGQSAATENFQVDGGAPVRVPMMQQDNYPVKMGVDSDLGCTVSIFHSDVTFELLRRPTS